MDKRYLTARLGGADPKVLGDERLEGLSGERTRFVAMAGILVTTASVAAVSMFFALHHGVGISQGWAIVFAFFWGLVILNIDRFLVISMSGTRGRPWQMFGIMLPRLILAALLAAVVSTPLVLQIFAKDISAELPILQQQKSAQFNQKLNDGTDAKNLQKIQAQINALNGNGGSSTPIQNDQAAIAKLNGEISAAKAQANTDYAKWQCEAGGLRGSLCPPGTSGLVGQGPLANADEEKYNSDENTVSNLQNQLNAAEHQLKSDQNTASQNVAAQQATLKSLDAQKQQLQASINAQIAAYDNSNDKDNGLLAQINALDAASAINPGLSIAHWTVLALFFAIEILPVSVKCLLLLGRKTGYERVAEARENHTADLEDDRLAGERKVVQVETENRHQLAEEEARSNLGLKRRSLESEYTIEDGKARTRESVEQDMREKEEGIGKKANLHVAEHMVQIVDDALKDWATEIRGSVARARERQSANGKVEHEDGQSNPGYDMRDGSDL
jgi:hypothetical protein